MFRQCDIIIPVYNQVDVTINCLNSLIRHTDENHPICLVDDCSRADEIETLEAHIAPYPRITLLKRDQNGGFSATVNYGIERTASEYICLLNNDTEVTEGWIDTLLDHLAAHPDIGIVNPATNQFNFTHGECQSAPPNSHIFTQSVTGFCMVFNRDIINRIGMFDTVFGRGYFEDTDFCYRARHRLGLRSAIVLNAFVYHFESRTFGRKSKERYALKQRNYGIFTNRWGVGDRFIFVVPKGSESLFRSHYDLCFKIADSRNKITVITNSRRLFADINDPFKTVLPNHESVKSIYVGLPFFGLFSFSYLKFIASGKKYAKLLVFTNHFNGSNDGMLFVPTAHYQSALTRLV